MKVAFATQDLERVDAHFGWAKNIGWLKPVGAIGITMAFGHSLLAMSGEESLAQVNPSALSRDQLQPHVVVPAHEHGQGLASFS